jgi:hypothetical protein
MIILFLLLWPFIFLFPYTFNAVGFGNDFYDVYYTYKVYLLDSLAHSHLPLWSPSEACGFPFYSNPFAQVLYPLNLPLVVFYRLNNGYSPYAHQLFTIFGLSLFAAGFYLWMRSLSFDRRAALFAALVITVSFKMTEILRFPNAVHTAAWYPWILWSINSIFNAKTLRRQLYHGALNMVFVFCLLTAGYLYYAYYSIFLFLPYLLIFFIPALSVPLFGGRFADKMRPLGLFFLSSLVPLLACAPYLVKVKGLLSQTVDRAGGSFEYSTAHVFGLKDTLGSLVYPPVAQSEGWYYFGCLGLFLVALYFISRNREDGGQPAYSGPGVKTFFALWIALITLITYGKHSYLFTALWYLLPGFKSLRTWGRLNIVLVPILGWLLAAGYRNFEGLVGAPGRKRALAAAAGLFAAAFLLQVYFIAAKDFHYYWLNYFVQIKLDHTPGAFHPFILHSHLAFPFFCACSFLLLLYWLRAARRPAPGRVLFLCLAVLSAADLWAIGPWMWMARKKVSMVPPLEVQALDTAAFAKPRVDTYNGISLTSSFNAGVLANWYFERYVRFRSLYGGDKESLNELLGITDGKRLFFTAGIDHASVKGFLADAARMPQAVSVLKYDGDSLAVELDQPRGGYLSFIDNWDPDWTVSVDGEAARLELLFGTFKSVKVPRGAHRVVFAYRPF